MPDLSKAQKTLAKIHIAKQQLGLDDATYRELLNSVAGVTSSTQLNALGRVRVLERMKDLGWKPSQPKKGTRPRVTSDRQKLMDKIEALLADRGLHWNYLTKSAEAGRPSMLERITGKRRFEWCHAGDLHKVVAALSVHARRVGKSEEETP